MMKKDLKLTKRLVPVFFGIVFCMLPICGCGRSGEINTEDILKNEDHAGTEQIDRYDLELAYNAYEKDFSDELEIGNEKIPLEIWSSNIGYRVIKIDGQEIPIEIQGLPLGGAGLELEAHDFTDDGKEEIVLVESSGASGSVQYILVFGNTDGQWEELDIPSDIYSDENDPEFLKKQMEELNVELDASVYNKYRTVSVNEEKILIEYSLFLDTDSGSVDMGMFRKELVYSSKDKGFVAGDILYIPATN